ncbi:hypothetical protein [Chitinophaga sp. YIM B06452]|uniref:hypothetical protein n=1 Tax=Chitinophaga sp. YIM B06452 TaxID=3082158 RepID=UPI0031FED0B8
MKYLSRPDIQLYLIAVLTYAAGVIVSANTAQDIHMHDVYNASEGMGTAAQLGLFIALEAIVYTVTQRFRQSRILQVLHVASVPLFPFAYLFTIAPAMPRRYYDYEGGPYQLDKPFNTLTYIALLVFITGQVIFIVNLVNGFRRGRRAPQEEGTHMLSPASSAIQMLTIALMMLAAGITTQLSFVAGIFLEGFIPAATVAAFFAFEALVYALTARFRQSPLLQRLHIVSTFVLSLALFFFYYFVLLDNLPPGYHFNISIDLPTALYWFIPIVFFAGLAVFAINVILGFVRGKK